MKRREGKKLLSLKRTLLYTYFIAVIICFAVGLYNFISSQILLSGMASYSESIQKLSEVQTAIQTFQDDVDDYLFSRSSTALQQYYDHSNDLVKISESLQADGLYTNNQIKYKNLSGYIEYYLEKADGVILAKRNEKTAEYVELYEQVGEDYRLINQYIQNMMAAELQESTQQYNDMQSIITFRTGLSYTLFGVSILFVVVLVISLSNSMSMPITKLAGYARRMAEGEYNIVVDEDISSEEVSQLYDAFGIMVENTRLYLDSIRENQSLENELTRQRIISLEKDNLLQKSELQALHAQMNPHFIFNTINIGSKLAMMQGDDVVCDYLETAADVFRYNLKGLDDATLAEELQNVKAYMRLLTIRFGHKLRFSMKVDDAVDMGRVWLPRMTLQPLVENAFVHGVSPCEDGGHIEVMVKEVEDFIKITVANSGQEFPREEIDSLYSGGVEKNPGHLSGIGLKNVLRRLQLQFDLSRPVEIFSGEGETKVILMIPAGRET